MDKSIEDVRPELKTLWGVSPVSTCIPFASESDVKKALIELTKPWPRDEIRWRVGPLNKDKNKTVPLAYVDARTVMDRLDNVMGAYWQDKYEFHGTRTICYLSLKLGGEWITRSDGAGDSDMEAEKGGISDAFKRASVKWGMGRELYELKCKWVPIDEYKKIVGDPWNNLIGGVVENGVHDDDSRNEAKLLWLKQIYAKMDKVGSLQELQECFTEKEKDYVNKTLVKLDPIACAQVKKRKKELEDKFKRDSEEELEEIDRNHVAQWGS